MRGARSVGPTITPGPAAADRCGVVRRCGMLALGALVLVLVWLASTGEARADEGRAAGAASSRLVPVWVQLDGGLPVDLGRVSVVATTNDPAHVGERRPLRQRTGRRSERTNPAGVAMLDFARLPKRFTVVVRGGRAYGRRVRGALYAEVTRRGSDVVEVNPVTTLSAFARAAGRGMGAARARRGVKRMLAIPSWHDTTRDVSRSDRYFDGEAYLAAARRRGSVQALNRVLLAELRDGDRDRRRFRELDVRAAQLQWLTLRRVEQLVEVGLGQLANFAAGKLAERKKDGGLGWFTGHRQGVRVRRRARPAGRDSEHTRGVWQAAHRAPGPNRRGLQGPRAERGQ